jgi:hypothetical protein
VPCAALRPMPSRVGSQRLRHGSLRDPAPQVISWTQSWPWLLAWVLEGGAIMAHVVFWLVALIAAALTGPMGFTVVIAAWIGFKRPLRTLARQLVEHAPFAS